MFLKITLVNGDVHEFPFGPGSQLTVTTPDGENGIKHGSWGEVGTVETVDETASGKKTKADLVADAEALGIDVPSSATKADVEQLIADHEAA